MNWLGDFLLNGENKNVVFDIYRGHISQIAL